MTFAKRVRSNSTVPSVAQMTSLSLRQLEEFDPRAAGNSSSIERRFLCPLCGEGKPRDAAHRSLGVNTGNGAWLCHRCGEKGKLAEWRSDENLQPVSRRQATQRRLRQAFSLDASASPVSTSSRTNVASRANASFSPDFRPDDIEHAETASKPAAWRKSLGNLCLLAGTPGESYLASRNISLEEAHAAGARFSPSWFGSAAVVFPIRDENGVLVAAQGRYLRAGSGPKARTAGSKKAGVFTSARLWEEVKRGAPVVICEAPLDALSLAMCGYPALALCGKDGWPSWLPIRCAFKSVALAFDADDAGDAGAARLHLSLSSLGARAFRLRPEGGKDWNEILQEQGKAMLADAVAPWLL